MANKSRKNNARPVLCPCPSSCQPIYSASDLQQRDMAEGHSGDCWGKMAEEILFQVGGIEHRNDLNHCIFTTLKGILRYQENEGDLESCINAANHVLQEIHPLNCSECGQSRIWTRFLFSKRYGPVCEACSVRLGLRFWREEDKQWGVWPNG